MSSNHEVSTAARLREIGAELDKIYADLDKPLRRGLWLRGLRFRTRALANTTLKAMPRASRKQQSAWTEAALTLLKAQYDEWIQQLDSIRNRVKTDDSPR